MAGEEMPERISERRRNRAGSNLNLNLNGGGVLLLLGAAAGALLASAFAAHRIRAHKRRRGSMKDGIQRDSCEHHASHEGKVFVGAEGEAGDGLAGEGVVQVNSHENLDASVQISQADQREIDFNLLEEWKGEVAERSPETDIELFDGEDGKLAGCRDSSADTSSSPANASRNLGSGSSLGENRLRYDDGELVASSVNEEQEFSCITSKEDDDEDSKKNDREECGETSSNFFSEQSRLLGIGSSPVNVHNNMGICGNLEEDQLRYDDEQLVPDSFKEEIEAPFINREEDDENNKKAYIIEWGERKELEGKITHPILNVEDLYLPKIGSSPVNDHNDMGIYSNLGEDQLRYNDEQLVADSLREELEAPFINREDQDNQKNYIEKWGERKELEEKITPPFLNVEDLCLPKVIHPLQIGSSPMNVRNNMGICSNLGEDQLRYDDEKLVAIGFREDIEAPFINREEDEEDNKKAYIEEWGGRKELEEKITQSILNVEDLCLPKKKDFQNLDVVVAIEERKIEYGFMDETYNSILEFVLSRAKEMTISSPLGDQDEINQLLEKIEPFFATNGEAKQALSVTQMNSHKDPIVIIAKEDDQSTAHTNGIVYIEEDKKKVEESSHSLVDEGVDGLFVEIQGIEIGSSPVNVHNNMGICGNLEEDQLRYDDEQLVPDSFKEEIEAPFINREEDDENNKKAYIIEWGERKELEGKITHPILNVEDLYLPKIGSSPVNDHNDMGIYSNLGEDQLRYNDEQLVADSLREELEAPFINREDQDNQKNYIEKWGERKELEEKITPPFLNVEDLCLTKVIHPLQIGSSPMNVRNNMGICSNLGEDQLRYDDEKLVAIGFREDIEAPFINREEDEEDNKKAYIEEWGGRKELEEKITQSILNVEDLCLPKKKDFQNLDVVVAIEERKIEYGFMDETYNSILEFVLSRAKEMTISSPLGDQDEINQLLEKIEPFFATNGEAKQALSVTQMNSHKDPIVIIAKEDDQSTAHTNGIVYIEEDKKKVEESSHSLVDEGVDGLFVEIQGIENNKLNCSKKTLEGEECQACNQALVTSADEVEREDEIISVQLHEIEAHNDKLERKTEFPQNLGVGEILNESQSQIKEVEERQTLKLSSDLVEKGFENNLSSERKLQRIAVNKAKGMEQMFGHIFLATILATAFAILAFIYAKDFFTRTAILQNFFDRLSLLFYQ